MAEFVTQKENTRRMILLVTFIVIDVIALGLGIFSMKKASDIENGEKEVNTIVKSRAEVKKLEAENLAIQENMIAFSQPVGWREHATWSIDRIPTGTLKTEQLKSFLNDWTSRLSSTEARKGAPESMKFQLLKTLRDLKTETSAIEKANDSDRTTASTFLQRLSDIEKNIPTKKYPLWREETSGGALTLKDLFEELEALEEAYTELASAIKTRTTAIGDVQKQIVSKAQENLSGARKKLENTIGDLIGKGRDQRDPEDLVDPEGLLRELHQVEVEGPVRIAAKRKELAVVQEQLEKRSRQNDSYRVEMEGRMKDLKTRIEWMKFRKEEARERQDPDGEILAVVPDQQIAYIDLVQNDHLFRGMIFDVYSLEQGGLKIKKGKVEVIQVREDGSSVVAVTKVSDPTDPIKAGDRIFNEAFEKGKKQYIAFAGSMYGKMSNEELSSMIRQVGDEYQNQVDERTSFVVIGNGYEKDPNFDKALELGVRLILERSLLHYLGVK